jgi:hypothetical protein
MPTQAQLGGLTNTQLRATAVPISAAALPLPAGAATAALQTQPGVDIGDVTVNNAAGAAAVNIQDGGNTITVDGDKSNNAAAPGATNVGAITALANAAAPAWTEGNLVLLSTTLAGLLRTENNPVKAATSTNTSIPRNAASVTLLASNTARKGGTIYNDAAANLFIIFGVTATTAAFTVRLQNTDYYEIPFNYTGVIAGIWASAGAGNAVMSELT